MRDCYSGYLVQLLEFNAVNIALVDAMNLALLDNPQDGIV
jgi:hypothetical protein